jgi:ribonuclease M5
MEKTRIKEVIVVEGRDDEAAVLRAAEAATIATHGYGIRQETLGLIENAYKKQGIIIFTDPDHAGEAIRKRLARQFPEAKHAFLSRSDAEKDGDIGIENALPAAILDALVRARADVGTGCAARVAFTTDILDEYGLTGLCGSGARRSALGKLLGIGECNASQFVKRLNKFGITREELEEACRQIKV